MVQSEMEWHGAESKARKRSKVVWSDMKQLDVE